MPTDSRLVRRALIASFGLYIVLGLPDGVFGTVWPGLRDDFGRSDGGLGFLILCTAVGYGGGSVGSGHLGERLGMGRVLPAAMALASMGLGAVAVAGNWWAVGAGYLLLGLGWGIADAGLNAWMALTQGPRQMGLLHASYGIGAFLGPLLATAFVADGGSWRGPYVVCAALTVGAVVTLLRARRGFAAAPLTAELTARATSPPGSNRLMVLMVAWFSVYVGLEVTIGSWSFTFLTEGRGESDIVAGVVTAGFWGGLMVGRFGLAAFGHRLEASSTLRTSTLVALAGAVWLWMDPGRVGWIALPVLGLALSMMFPVVMGRTGVYIGEERTARAVGYQIGASTVGFTVLPALVGVIADAHGVDWAAPVIVATVVVVGTLWLAIEREVNPNRG